MGKANVKIAYLNPPVILARQFFHYPLFTALGLYQNAAVSRQAGHAVGIVDSFYLFPELQFVERGKYRMLGASPEVCAEAVAALNPEVVFVYVSMYNHPERWAETTLPEVFSALRRALPLTPIGINDCFIGGLSYYPYDASRLLEAHPELDFCLTLETEITTQRFLDALASGTRAPDIPGAAVRRPDGQVIWRQGGEQVKDLDTLPYPAFDLLNMENFFKVQSEACARDLIHEYTSPRRILPVITSRGCPHRCVFCQNSVLKVQWRGNSVAYVDAMLGRFFEDYRPDLFFLLDENISVNRGRFDALVKLLADRKFAWDAVNGIRADHIGQTHLRHMVLAQCPKLTTSGESAEERVLRDVVHKGLKPDTIDRLAALCGRERMPLQVHWVVGMPGESKRDVLGTLFKARSLMEEHRVYPLVMHAVPSPGTELRKKCLESGFMDPLAADLPLQEEYSTYQLRTPHFDGAFISKAIENFSRLVKNRIFLPQVLVTNKDNNNWLYLDRPRAGAPLALYAAASHMEHLARTKARGVIFYGGEPTVELHNLAILLRLAVKNGLRRAWLISNARVFSYLSVARRFREAGLHGVQVEVPSVEAARFDEIAGVEGAFRETMLGIENLFREGVKVVISTTVLRSTAAGLREVARFAASLGTEPLLVRKPKPFVGRRSVMTEIPDHATFVSALEGLDSRAVIVGVPSCILGGVEVRNELDLSSYEEMPYKFVPDACWSCPEAVSCRHFWRPDLAGPYQEPMPFENGAT